MKIFSLRLILLAGIFLAGFAPREPAQSLSTLFTNGPATNRIKVVFIAEGYQLSESNKFIGDAISLATNLMSVPPYSEYTNYFNTYALFIASTNSGSNHSPYGTANTNTTCFSSSYNSSPTAPQLITIPPNDRDTNPTHGKPKLINLLMSVIPDYDIPILVVNDTTYGGSGNTPDATQPLVIVSIDPTNNIKTAIIAHESGHIVAGLADEYTNAILNLPNLVQRPNATTNTAPALIPWTNWFVPSDILDFGVPTDPSLGQGFLGLYLGAQYHTNIWYRPTINACIMNNIQWTAGNKGLPAFCTVCTEAIVLGLYQNVHFSINTIDSVSPATNSLTLTTTNAFAFTATRLQPNTHNLTLQWFTNGIAVAGATNSAFNFAPANLTNGSYTVRAQVRDNTPLVRNDPNNYLSNSVAWNVTVARSSLQLVSPQWLPSGQFSCIVTGVAVNGFVMQTSTNFATWTPLATNTLSGGAFSFTNNPAGITSRFYRALAN